MITNQFDFCLATDDEDLFLSEAQLRAHLRTEGLTSPAADDMWIGDVVWQVNEVNGGEFTIFVC